MYCMREGDTWWCITDGEYIYLSKEDIHKSEDSLMKLRFFKKFGKEYIKKEDGTYAIKEEDNAKQ